MTTTTPNPAELAAKAKRLSCSLLESRSEKYRLVDELNATIDQLRDLASGPSAGAERDLRKFEDPAFNEWLEESITENGEFTVRDSVKDLDSAYSGWCARPHYAAPAATPPAEKEVRVPLTDEQIETGENEFGDGCRAPDYYAGFYHGVKFAERAHGISAAALSEEQQP